jgi:hypothetical protein
MGFMNLYKASIGLLRACRGKKVLLEAADTIPPSQQRLIFAGIEHENVWTLAN